MQGPSLQVKEIKVEGVESGVQDDGEGVVVEGRVNGSSTGRSLV